MIRVDTANPPLPTAPFDSGQSVPAPMTSRMILAAIALYQQCRVGRPTGCRYLPTCSAYADEAVQTYGATRGSLLAVRRLLRCHPWGGHGVDPVPDRSAVCRH